MGRRCSQKEYGYIASDGAASGMIASYADGFGPVELPPDRYDELVDALLNCAIGRKFKRKRWTVRIMFFLGVE